MAACFAAASSDAKASAAPLPDAETSALEALEAALLVDEDGLFVGAAHAASITAQQHRATNPANILFMAAFLPGA